VPRRKDAPAAGLVSSAAVRTKAFLGVVVAAGTVALTWAGSARDFGSGPLQDAQARYGRVREARQRTGRVVDQLFAKAGADYPAPVLLRAFKDEGLLELWALSGAKGRFVRVAAFPFTGTSGDLGPKRRRWDRQIPEGFYKVKSFNGASRFHLSLEVDYPNASDRVLSDRRHPGNNIFIHGNELSIGCIPLGDLGIEQVYLAVLDSASAGFEVPVQIFPCSFADPECQRTLQKYFRRRPALKEFWANLEEGYRAFEQDGVPRSFTVDERGRYVFATP
jgi:murein L,D-transpeptidase YafK